MNELTLPPSPNWYCINIIAYANDGTIAWGSKHTIVIGKPVEDQKIFKFSIISDAHTDKVTSLVFCPEFGRSNKNLLLSGGCETVVRVWNLDSPNPTRAYSCAFNNQHAASMDWSKKNTDIICCVGTEGSIIVCDVIHKTSRLINLGKINATCISCCPHDIDVVAVGEKGGLIYIINLHNTGSIKYKFRGHDCDIVSLSWCPTIKNIFNTTDWCENDWMLASGGRGRSIFIWKAGDNGRFHCEIHLPTIPLVQQQYKPKLSSAVSNWIAICWVRPELLISNSPCGELISWDLTNLKKNKPSSQLVHAKHKKGLFSIATVQLIDDENEDNWRDKDSIILWTVGQDRKVICCKIEKNESIIEYNIPTQGGFIYCIAPCPVETSNIAFGVGDGMIRLWNLSNAHENSYEVKTLWEKISGKVKSLSWHPEKENLLTFGTDNGRIGIFDVNHNKPPILLRQYHRDTVYGLEWGPKLHDKEFTLFSSSQGELVYYNTEHPLREPVIVIKRKCSSFSWKPDLSYLAVGFDNGDIAFFNQQFEKISESFFTLKKPVHRLVWHPECTRTDLTVSPMCNHLAVAFDSPQIIIVDLSQLMQISEISDEKNSLNDAEQPPQSKVNIHEVIATLKGHSENVTHVSWNPHLSGYLASCSYDQTVLIWKIDTQEIICAYTNHIGFINCCMWSPINPDLVISGSSDLTLQVWRISKQKEDDYQEKILMKKKQRKERHSKTAIKFNKSKVDNQNSVSQSSISKSNEESLELGSKSDNEIITPAAVKKEKSDRATYFQKSLKVLNNKSTILDAIKKIISNEQDMNENTSDPENQEKLNKVLILFSSEEHILSLLNNERNFLAAEQKHHVVSEIDIWGGKLKEALENATAEQRLDDFLVGVSASLSMKTWRETCEAYANQLALNGNPLKAASYLLCIHKNLQAVEILKDAKFYREAYALATCKLDPDDSIFNNILTSWANYNVNTGNLEQAALCFTKLGEYANAAKYLARRENLQCIELAAALAALSDSKESSKLLATRAMIIALGKSDYTAARKLIEKFPNIKNQEILITIHSEVKKIINDNQIAHIQDWLQGSSDYGLLQVLEPLCDGLEAYSDFQDIRKQDFFKKQVDENMLLVNLSYLLAMVAVSNTEEKRSSHLINAIDIVFQHDLFNRNKSENLKLPFMLILSKLDIKKPTDENSIYKATNNLVSKSLRAYLCFGLLRWLVDEVEECDLEQYIEPATTLIQNLLSDAIDEYSVKYWSTANEINKLEETIVSMLGEKQEGEQEDENEKVSQLVQKLDASKALKQKFVQERICSPSPIIVYSKANEFIARIRDDNTKSQFSQELANVWKNAIMT